MSNIIEVNDETFDNEIKQSELVVVDFWATWCGPCRKLSPLVDEVADQYQDKIKFVKANIEDCVEKAKECSVIGIPCLLIFKNGQIAERMTGLMSKNSIISNLEKHL